MATYTFASLRDLADYIEHLADNVTWVGEGRPSLRVEQHMKGEVYAYRRLAQILRETTLGDGD